MKSKNKIYDLIIIGTGPAGLTAGIYAGRYLLKTLVIGKLEGGTITEAYKICNFPSYQEISGLELVSKMVKQVRNLGVRVKGEEVTEVKKVKGIFKIKSREKEYESKKLILAVGRKKRKLNVPGEKEFLGRGVSYCATCDGPLFRNKVVGVVGGSDAALTSALLLSEYAKKVYLLYRRERFFRAEPAWIRQVEKNEKIETIFNIQVKKIFGKNILEGAVVNNQKKLKMDGLFVEIGALPNKKLPQQLGLLTEKGYVKVNKEQETSLEGVYAAGDITNSPLKQVVTASAEGAIAAKFAYKSLIKEE